MPDTFDLADLSIPEDSEYHRLKQRCPGVRCLRFGDGEHLTRYGELADDIFLIMKGGFDVEERTDSADSRPGVLASCDVHDVSSPAFIGEMAHLGSAVRVASVRSRGECYTIAMRPDDLAVITAEFPVFTRILCRQFSERLRKAVDEVNEHRRLFATQPERRTLEAGEVLFARGDAADTLFQLLDGAFVRETEDGEEPIHRESLFLGVLDPMPYFCDAHHESTVKATSEAKVIAFRKTAKLALVRTMPELVLHCLREASAGRGD
ncbi:MAG: cyclic nucleotide-binding domain-containing protein [Candidatus Hydrogenedentes bacterium]|nr:cyclic nucleotide-binding domain-containing protein [Candidatus Hydrogenedentota bacterium]